MIRVSLRFTSLMVFFLFPLPLGAALQKVKDAFQKTYQQMFQNSWNEDFLEAARRKDTKKMDLLLAKGAQIEARDEKGITALMRAVADDDVRIVGFLLRRGARVDARDKEGKTALMVAAFREYERMVEILIDAGADVNAVDKNGVSLALYASPTLYQLICDRVYARNQLICDKEYAKKHASEIAEAFEGSKRDHEPLSQKASFTNLVKRSTAENPFFLAVIPVKNNFYHFFSAYELATTFACKGFYNPLNENHIERVLVYRCNGPLDGPFPFNYQQTIHNSAQELKEFCATYDLKIRGH